MSFPSHATYKESGVQWLGDIPSHWTVEKFRRLFRESSEKIEGDVIGPMLSVSGYRGIEIKEYDDDNRRRLDEDLQGYRIVRVGQLVVNTMWLNYAGLGVSEFEGHVSPAYRSYDISDKLDRRFIHHLMRSSIYVQGYTRLLTGIRPNSLQMSRDDLMEFPILSPPRREQSEIANFIDHETSKIDALLDEQKRLIELLKEKRQAVVSHAVTRGLDPNATMKYSGVEWLGNMPDHWEMRTIAKSSTKITNGYVGPTRDILVKTGVPYIQATHIKGGRINFDDEYFVTQEWSNSHAKSVLDEEDVLIVQTGAGTGDVGIVSRNEIGFNCHALIIITPDKTLLCGTFLAAVLRSNYGQAKLTSIQTGAMHPHLNCGEVKFVEVPLPPLAEQANIVSYLRGVVDRFEVLTTEAQRAIDLLQERRSALISAAVTGKIDVRGLIPSASEAA